MSEYFLLGNKRFIAEQSTAPRFRFVWDDENPDWNFKCRTQHGDFTGPDNPPAVIRFYPEMREKSGDYRVNLASPYDWKPAIIAMNGGDGRKFDYLIGPSRAQFNTTGWPQMAYVGMCGNEIEILEKIDTWYKFKTLKQSDVSKVQGWNINTHPKEIHRFTCVTFKNGATVRINSTGTARGDVFYPLITREGFAYIPVRHVVKVQ